MSPEVNSSSALEAFKQSLLSKLSELDFTPTPEQPAFEIADISIVFEHTDGEVSGIELSFEQGRGMKTVRDFGSGIFDTKDNEVKKVELWFKPSLSMYIVDNSSNTSEQITGDIEESFFLDQLFSAIQLAALELDPNAEHIRVFASNYNERCKEVLERCEFSYEKQRVRTYIQEAIESGRDILEDTGEIQIHLPFVVSEALANFLIRNGHSENIGLFRREFLQDLNLPGKMIYCGHDFGIHGYWYDGFTVTIGVMTVDMYKDIKNMQSEKPNAFTELVSNGEESREGKWIDPRTFAFMNGGGRPYNQDAYAVDTEADLYGVADGMGGMEAGEVASDAILDHFLRCGKNKGLALGPIFHVASEVIDRAISKPKGNGGTTFAGIRIQEYKENTARVDTCTIADSIVLAVHPKHGVLLKPVMQKWRPPAPAIKSRSHNPGVVAEHNRLYDLFGHHLDNALSRKGLKVAPLQIHEEYPYGTRFIMLSDGVSGIVLLNEIEQIFINNSFQAACEILMNLIIQRQSKLSNHDVVDAVFVTEQGKESIRLRECPTPDNAVFLAHELTK